MKHKPTKYEERPKKKGAIYLKKREKYRAKLREQLEKITSEPILY